MLKRPPHREHERTAQVVHNLHVYSSAIYSTTCGQSLPKTIVHRVVLYITIADQTQSIPKTPTPAAFFQQLRPCLPDRTKAFPPLCSLRNRDRRCSLFTHRGAEDVPRRGPHWSGGGLGGGARLHRRRRPQRLSEREQTVTVVEVTREMGRAALVVVKEKGTTSVEDARGELGVIMF